MSNISYFRAGVSCSPFIGIFVSLYNAVEVGLELQPTSFNKALFKFKIDNIEAKATLSALRGETEGVDEAIQELAAERTKIRNERIPLYEKGRSYAIYGIAANVLTIAATIGLIALKIFRFPFGIVMITSYTFNALSNGYVLYKHTEALKTLQSPMP